MFKKLTDGFQSTLAQAGEQAKSRNAAVGATSSPRHSTSAERGPARPHVPYDEEGDLEAENENPGNQSKEEAGSDGSAPVQDERATDMPPDLQKKLNKLAKYEQKYPELLRAYRALQSTDANVKTFEKALGEITPATSIEDVEAFQQWANNFTLKTEMSMTELRRVGQELVTLQSSSKEKNDAYELQIAGLKQQLSESQDIQSTALSSENETEYKQQIASLTDELAKVKSQGDAYHLEETKFEQIKSTDDALTKDLEAQKISTLEVERKLDSLEKSSKRSLDEAHTKTIEATSEIEVLKKDIIDLKILHAQELRKAQAISRADSPLNQPVDITKDEAASTGGSTPLSKGQKKRKNKKKNGGKSTEENESAEATSSTTLVNSPIIPSSSDQIETLIQERDDLLLAVDTLRATSDSFAAEKLSYEKKIKKLSEHQESIEEIRDMMKEVGNDLVEAKDQVKSLIGEKASLNTEITGLRSDIENLTTENTQLVSNITTLEETKVASADAEALKHDISELQTKLSAAEEKLRVVIKDLEIAEKLSAERFKELSGTRDNLRLVSSELNDLKKDNQKILADKSTIDSSLKSVEARAKALERAEKDRRDELTACQKNLASREKELKVIQTAFKEEETRRKSEEGRASALKSEVAKLTVLRDSIISSRNEVNGQLTSIRSELENANTKLASLQQLRNKLTLERDAAQEELQMGQAKFDSSQSLMESQREQTVDMQHRLRETTERSEAMEEELSEAQRQLTERNREAETLRRLLSEIEGNQESRLRDMRERMETAIAERDKAEDEAAFNGKKRAREVEDLKERLMDLERTVRKTIIEKQDLSSSCEELRKAKGLSDDEAESRERDLKDLRNTMNDLSHSLRDAESQISMLEQDRNSLRAEIKNSINSIERLNADITAKDDLLNKLRNERAHMLDRQDSFQSPIQARRASHNRSDSTSSTPLSPSVRRTPSMQSIALSDRPKEKAEVDREYIKNVLFQFLEHRDKRKYLMPAISKLLMLSKQQEGVFHNALK